MPTIPAHAPTGTYKTYEQSITLPHAYAAGHVLTDNDAKFFNQQVATSVINRLGAMIRREIAALDEKRAAAFKAKTYDGPMDASGKKPAPATLADTGLDVQAKATALFTEFEPGVSSRGGGSGESSDPIASEMRRLAGVAVRDKYKEKGFKYADFLAAKYNGTDKSMYAHHVDQYLDAKGDQLRAIVEAQRAAMANVESGDDGLDLAVAAE